MSGHDEIEGILLDMLQTGLLRIRAFGESSHAEACRLEADHLHNIPCLIKSIADEELASYYNIDRPAFMSATTFGVADFEVFWERLEKLMKSDNAMGRP